MNLGERIARARKTATPPMSQGELARACGWKGWSRVGNYEQGLNKPGVDELGAIAKATGVNEAWLAYEIEPMRGALETPRKMMAVAEEPATFSESVAISRLRQDVSVIRRALALLVLAVDSRAQGAAKAFAELLKTAVPDAYYGERGFHVTLEELAALLSEIQEAEPVAHTARPARPAKRTTPR